MTADDRINRLVKELSPVEAALKYVFENHLTPEQAVDAMKTDRELKNRLGRDAAAESSFVKILHMEDSDEILKDELFFRGGEDVYLNIHARYMPPYAHKHSFFELQYVLNGSLYQNFAGQSLTLHKGDICFIAPETEHALSVFDDGTIVANLLIRRETFRSLFINLLKENDIISDFFSRVLFCNSYYPYIYCRPSIEPKLTAIILDMMETAQSDMRLKNRLLVNRLEELFIYLLNYHEYDFVTGSCAGETDKKILPILRYIQDHFRTVTLTDAAKQFNYSEAYLSRLITTYSGSGFSQIVKTARLHNAARLLESTDMSIADVCADSGYDDRNYFHRTFKKQFGMTPAEYRKNCGNGSSDVNGI